MNTAVIKGQDYLKMMIHASNMLEGKKAYVDSLNVFPVPDGDTGTNMSMTFRSAVESILNEKTDSVDVMSRNLAKGALMGARGNSGVILSQIFRGIAKGFEGKGEIDSKDLANALKEGANSAYRAVMRPTEGTILTVIREVGDAALTMEESDLGKFMEEVCKVAENTLNKTPDLLPQLKEAGVVDSGGMGLFIILKAMHKALVSEVSTTLGQESASGAVAEGGPAQELADIKYGYCTEFIVKGAIQDSMFQNYLEERGDSIVFVTMDDVTKIHIHTENPGEVMQRAQAHGELLKIKIENMREQNRKLQHHEESDFVQDKLEVKKDEPAKAFGFIAVAAGEGMEQIFQDLNCDLVIQGGQTMNPSTKDILSAIEEVNAEEIFILPNNKNIILSANQTKELTEKHVHVLETKTLPQGIACLAAFDTESTLEENLEAMEEAKNAVRSGQITYAVRDTELDGQKITAGDYLGLLENKIKFVQRDLYSLADQLVKEMVTEDSSIISIYAGEQAKEEEIAAFVETLEKEYEECDVISIRGDQPVYYLILSVE